MLQLLAEGSYYTRDKDNVEMCLDYIYPFLLVRREGKESLVTKYIFQDHVPPPPDDTAAESPKLQFSVVECILFAFHQLLNKVINL